MKSKTGFRYIYILTFCQSVLFIVSFTCEDVSFLLCRMFGECTGRMRRFAGRQKSPQEVIRTLKEGLQLLSRYENKEDKRRQKV